MTFDFDDFMDKLMMLNMIGLSILCWGVILYVFLSILGVL